jgi:hypothetical protein
MDERRHCFISLSWDAGHDGHDGSSERFINEVSKH